MEMFTDSVRREAATCRLPLRISTVAPGAVLTPLLDAFTDKMLQWCATHQSSPFVAGCAATANTQAALKARGLSAAIIGVTADKVADSVIEAIEAYQPKARYVVLHPFFAPMYYLPLILPEAWGDWFTGLV